MSGETEANVSGWTVDTVHSKLVSMMDERDQRYAQRFLDLNKALDAAFAAAQLAIKTQEREVASALAAAEKAVSKAEMASEKRFEGVNEFRAALADSAGRNLTRNEYDSAHVGLVEKVDTLTRRFERLEGGALGRDSSASRVQAIVFGVVGALIGLVGVGVAIAVAAQ